jgi:hypothetical protein
MVSANQNHHLYVVIYFLTQHLHWLHCAVCVALKRKGKGDDVTEDDMDGFIAAHNCESTGLRYMAMFAKAVAWVLRWPPTHSWMIPITMRSQP